MATKQNPLTPEGSAGLSETFMAQLRDRFTDKDADSIDIVDAILEDHKALKDLIPLLKSEDAGYVEKRATFKLFAAALEAHAKPEGQTWYVDMKKIEDLKVDGVEGDVEHDLADQLTRELKATTSEDLFMGKVKVLAELLEHHLKEEEEEQLPKFKKATSSEEREKLGAKYLKLRSAYFVH